MLCEIQHLTRPRLLPGTPSSTGTMHIHNHVQFHGSGGHILYLVTTWSKHHFSNYITASMEWTEMQWSRTEQNRKYQSVFYVAICVYIYIYIYTYIYIYIHRERECMYVRLYMVGYGQKVWKSLHQGKEIDQKILLKYIDDLKANSRGPALLSYFRLYSLDITDPIFVLQGVIGQCQRSKDKSMTFNIFLNFHLNLIFYIYFFNFWLELSWFTMSC